MLESERNVTTVENDPSRLIESMKAYMYAGEVYDKKRNLYAAATLMRLWISSTVPLDINAKYTATTFLPLIDGILRTFVTVFQLE
jgi:hypothetical protein